MTVTDRPENLVEDSGHLDDAIPWDGWKHNYRPAADWREKVSDELAFHDEADPELDPVTYEVIRHRLWTINMSHGETITRISGSPVFASLDFNMCIMTEDAEVVLNAPFIQYLDSGAPLAIRYILERYSHAPGVDDGDMYLVNDPWISSAHQMDVMIACPVFVDGRLFAWVSSAGHQYDLGGLVPGGWPQNAVDTYGDPIRFTPIKLVEKGVLRKDLEVMYRRQSRVPDLVALDLRAQLAGAQYARNQLLELCARYGAPTVKATMRQVLDASQQGFIDKLQRIPDGTWSEIRYFDEKLPGDRTTHRVQVNITKVGDRIIVDNKGSELQDVGPNGFTYVGFAGAVIGTASVTMLHEQLFAIGGADRQIDYRPTPGLLSCVDFPAAVAGSVMNIITYMNAVQTCIGRMLACDPDLKHDVIAAGGESPLAVLAGFDDRGRYFGQALLEMLGMGSGARAFGDGIDTGGPTYSPLSFILNVESLEQWYPIVYLYRKEAVDALGMGKWRGGTGIDIAVTPYRAESIAVTSNTGGMGVSTHGGEGIFGGYPSPTCYYRVAKDTDLWELLKRKQIPNAVDDLASGDSFLLRGKSDGTSLLDGDVLAVRFVGGGGYGDPLERDPELVARDVRNQYVSTDAARAAHGVVVNDAGEVDDVATTALRRETLDGRGQWRLASELYGPDTSDPYPATGTEPRAVHEYLVAHDSHGERVLSCNRCSHEICGYGANFKLGLLLDESPVTTIPAVGDPSVFLDDEMLFRRYCCPNCKVLMACEVVRADEPVVPDMTLRSV